MPLKLKKDKRHARNVHVEQKAPRAPKRGSFRLFSPERLKGTSVVALLGAVGAGLLVGLALGSLHLYRYAVSSPFFAVKDVDVSGNVRLRREGVLELTGVRVGDNSLAVSIAGMERAVSRNPWVEEVAVKRILPDRFAVRLRERKPWFWIRNEGSLYYADEFGKPIAPVEHADFVSLPTLEVAIGAENLLPKLRDYVTDLRGSALSADYGAVSWIRLSPGKGVEVYLENRDMRLSVSPEDWSGNLSRLGTVLNDLARRDELSRTAEIRAADGSVWVIGKL
jgi:cell division protein FtsQ